MAGIEPPGFYYNSYKMNSKYLYILLLSIAVPLAAAAQQLPDTFRAAPWMQLRDSAHAVVLHQIMISKDCGDAREGSGQRPMRSIDEYVEATPSLSLMSRGAFGKEPMLRGMNTDRLRVTVDGMPVMYACIGKMDPATSYVESNNLDRIEVQSGGDELAFTSSPGGTLNLKTLDPKIGSEDKHYGRAGAEFQSNGAGRSAFLKWGRSSENWGVLINSTWRARDNYSDARGNPIDFSQYRKANLAMALKWRPGKKNIVDADLILDEAWNVGYPALPMDVPRASAQLFTLEWKSYRPRGKSDERSLRFFSNRVLHVMNNYTRDDGSMRMDMPGESAVIGISTWIKWQPGEKQTLRVKSEWMHTTAVASMTMFPEGEKEMYMLTWPDIARESWAGFMAYTLGRKEVEWEGSLRLETQLSHSRSAMGISQWEALGQDISKPDTRFLGGGGLTWRYHKERTFSLEAKSSVNLRAPTVSEQYGLYIYNASDAFVYLGNPALPNEKSLQISLGANYDNKVLQAGAECYAYAFRDYIIAGIDTNLLPLNDQQSGVKVYRSIKAAHLFGGNVHFRVQLLPHLTLMLRADYVDARDFEGNYLPFIPPLKGSATLRYARGKFDLSAEISGAASQNKVSRYNGEDATASYFLVNVNAAYNYKVLSLKGKLLLTAKNLTNTYFWDHLDWNNVPRPGRNIILSTVIDF